VCVCVCVCVCVRLGQTRFAESCSVCYNSLQHRKLKKTCSKNCIVFCLYTKSTYSTKTYFDGVLTANFPAILTHCCTYDTSLVITIVARPKQGIWLVWWVASIVSLLYTGFPPLFNCFSTMNFPKLSVKRTIVKWHFPARSEWNEDKYLGQCRVWVRPLLQRLWRNIYMIGWMYWWWW
jgi:hypothetical protein